VRIPVRKWGNSLALRIPKSVASDSKIRQGTVVEVAVVRGKLVIAPVRAPRHILKQLLAGVTKKNRHDETDTGSPVGRETW
jgi:antitoxin MazE